jgi:excisionase family DNA binding protein
MSDNLYSVEQVASRLGLHVRTVRNYVREGRLSAVRIGKQYRISASDLATMTGRPPASFELDPVRRLRHVEASSIVEIDALPPEIADRIGNLVRAAANSRQTSDSPLRLETIYFAERARMKIILLGDMDAISSMFKLIQVVLDAEKK